MFELKQLHSFLVLAEELHFGRAAKRLHMTQSPLSRQIQLLEHSLQSPLFKRNNRNVQLTPAGLAFRHEARQILALAENAVTVVRHHSQGRAGRLRMGFTAGSSYRHLPKLLSFASHELKELEIVLREMVTTQQMEALNAHQIDVGLGRQPPNPPEIGGIRIARERMLLAVPSTHPLAQQTSLRIEDLRGMPIISFSPQDGFYFYALIDSIFRQNNLQPQYVQHVSQIHSILALVNAGLGVAFVPETAEALHFDGVVLRRVRMTPVFADLYLLWSRTNPNPAIQTFVQLARKRLRITDSER
ncbi:transcriptional regulator, LysR family [Bryocella elongata]|uniref:Transcriptional regulator, LysR family n=1 Tax=Bryocella elongata TaxID=863522 RepID=A0A1H5ZKH9_9BACT|nr:LysR family transcriptional regulator [Bryocella elongata]SEG36610.1 transcriptional regulator, LysR family [Bryocella elongata]